jgi:virginiamycin B lyase
LNNCNWVQVTGSLKQISSTDDTVCGVNASNNIYCAKFIGTAVTFQLGWKQIPGSLKHVTVNKDGSLFGTNAGDEIFYCKNWQNCNWAKLPGALKQIDATANTVCGVNGGGGIYCSAYQ